MNILIIWSVSKDRIQWNNLELRQIFLGKTSRRRKIFEHLWPDIYSSFETSHQFAETPPLMPQMNSHCRFNGMPTFFLMKMWSQLLAQKQSDEKIFLALRYTVFLLVENRPVTHAYCLFINDSCFTMKAKEWRRGIDLTMTLARTIPYP